MANKEPLTYQEIAAKLIKDNFLLTALELHTQLYECGRELKELKDFFSNPGNFEGFTQDPHPQLSRSESQATLDSLDLTRFSEDGCGVDDRVAVLEFELRKAKETINALRNNLTVATESGNSTPDKGSLRHINIGSIKPHEQRALNFLINEYLLLNSYKLTSITFADENQHQDFDDWDDVGLNIAKPPELLSLYRDFSKQNTVNSTSTSTQTDPQSNETPHKVDQIEEQEYKQQTCLEGAVLSHSNESVQSEKFEIIEKRDSIVNIEDNISNVSFNANDWTNLGDSSCVEDNSKVLNLEISHDSFEKEVFALCNINIPPRVINPILDSILNSPITKDSLIPTLTQSLLTIIPNIIIKRREEALPLIMCAVQLNPDSRERDKLLQLLFNLKRRPSQSGRIMILTGVVGIARFAGEAFVENEILPQCWEQLTDKHVEKRLLITEACIALTPYVSSQIRNSLMLSMLQQLLRDREEIVRETVIKALSLLITLCNDPDKYLQCQELVLVTLNDPSPKIRNLSLQLLFPVLGRWALNTGNLTSHLFKYLLKTLNDCLRDVDEIKKLTNKVVAIIEVIEILSPFLLMSVASFGDVLDRVDRTMTIEIRRDLGSLCSNLTNPALFSKFECDAGMVLYEFDMFLTDNPKQTWSELDWIVDIMIPDLLNSLNHIETSHQVLLEKLMNLFLKLCIVFGREFTKFHIFPIFHQQVNNLKQVLSSFSEFAPSLNIVPVYLVAVLKHCGLELLSAELKEWLGVLPLCGCPLDCLDVTVRGLCQNHLEEVVVSCLWDGVVHQKPQVRGVTANLLSLVIAFCDRNLLVTKVTPALITLANDPDILVKTASVSALGNLLIDCDIAEIHDKVYMQLHTYITDSSLSENHTFLRQLVVTLGNVIDGCAPKFRREIALPYLTALVTHMAKMRDVTRKVDLAQALVEAFTTAVYSPYNKQDVKTALLLGLRRLEYAVFETQALIQHRETVMIMLRECEDISSPDPSKLSQMNQGVEDMRQKVSKIFTKTPKKGPIQSIFKKK